MGHAEWGLHRRGFGWAALCSRWPKRREDEGRGPKDSRGMPLVVGANVRHPQFGLGRIVNITSGQDARAI